MSTQTKVFATLLGATLLAPTLVLASDFAQAANGEAGMIFRDAPSTVTREQVRAELNASTATDVAGWKNVGGEATWTLATAHYVFDRGMLAHASDCPMLTAAASVPPADRSTDPLPGYSGA